MVFKRRGERLSQGAKAAYDAFASVYDEFTANHDYELWLGNLLPRLERHGLRLGRLLDVACGTGKSFIPMLARGWEVTGCDVSREMIERAREKVGDAARLLVADMRELPCLGAFELVWSLDDAVNYLGSTEELERALSGMRANLGAGGLLLFDVNTIRIYRTFFAADVTVETEDGRRLIWKGRGSEEQPPGSAVEASFEALPPASEGEDPLLPPAVHQQRHFPEAEVLRALASAGLECLEVLGHGQDAVLQQPLRDEFHTKAIYIARGA